MQKRIDWVDQVKGFAIFLVVYGHNFPITEKYVYSFHMPLFFMVSGFFFPIQLNVKTLKKRFNFILVPYFIWAFALFLFWVIIGRQMGSSGGKDLSALDNFVGIFYAQGGIKYMDWGIPMWFLPTIFLCFVFYFFLKKYIHKDRIRVLSVLFLVTTGFLFTGFVGLNLPWSINVSMVALFFFAFGNLTFKYADKISKRLSILVMILFAVAHFFLYAQNEKIDMYRSVFGNEFLFLMNGLLGSIFVLLFFKSFPYFKFLSVVGKFTLVILALQLLAMAFIKLFLWKVMGETEFHFSEIEKFVYSIIQICLIYPVFLIINKYIPILNGGYKKI